MSHTNAAVALLKLEAQSQHNVIHQTRSIELLIILLQPQYVSRRQCFALQTNVV
jgi:hypothetical protein